MNRGTWLAVGVAVLLGACGDATQPEDVEDFGSTQEAATKGSAGAQIGDSNFCDDAANKCALGEGDCDSSTQCQSGLTCVPGNLAKRGALSGDACAPAHCGNGSKDADETSIDCGGTCGWDCAVACNQVNGSASKCSTDCACSVGEGDCDSDAECQSGLVCGNGNGAAFQLPAGTDACWAPTCQNGVKDGDETAVDCGGSCVPCAPPPAGPAALYSGTAALPIVIAPHADAAIHNAVVSIANDLRDKLNAITGTTAFAVQAPSSTPSGISLGIDGDFPNTGWPYQGYFRPNDLYVGGVISPERLSLQEQYVLHSPAASNRVIVAGATVAGLKHAVWDLLGQLGYRHYFQTSTWEVIPNRNPLSHTFATSEKPAFAARQITPAVTYWNETGWQGVDNAEWDAWRAHNRRNTSGLVPTTTYLKVISYWEQRHSGQTFPPTLLTNAGTEQFCLTGTATLSDGQQVTALDAVKEWALAQTTPAILSLSPTIGANWDSGTNASGTLNCNDINDPVFSNVANRIVAIANAAAEVQPTKVITARVQQMYGDSPTIAQRQNVFMVANPAWSGRAVNRSSDSFVHEAALSTWSQGGAKVGLIDYFNLGASELPGKSVMSTSDLVARATRSYALGARQYSIASTEWGWGLAGPSLWALSHALWDADSSPTGEQYRADFFSNAFGPAGSAARKYYDVLENQPFWSEHLIGQMYRALEEGFSLTSDPAQQARLGDLAVYTRYLELYRKAFNRCSAVPPVTEQTELKQLLQFVYSTRNSKMLHSRDAFVGIQGAVPACPTGTTCTTNGCIDSQGQLTGVACLMTEWGADCPTATPQAKCGTCSGVNNPCNELKQGGTITLTALRTAVEAGAINNNILQPGLTRQFSNDLVPYTPENPNLPPKYQSIYTAGPYSLYLQRAASAGPLEVHVTKYGAKLLLLGQLSNASNNALVRREILGRGIGEADWSFPTTSSLYRLDLDDQGQRLWTSFPANNGTRIAIPTNLGLPPTAFNYRWAAYFMVPAGTTNVVGWSEADGTFFRNRKKPDNTWETIEGHLSDYAVGHACTTPSIVIDTSVGGALNDHFVIPIPADAPVTTDEIWLFNDGNAGTWGDRALLSVPPYLYRAPEEMLVPREVSPEALDPISCTTDANCPVGQYCSQSGQCRTDGGICSGNDHCRSGQTCQSGMCICASSGTCSSTCLCEVGGSCGSDDACRSGLSCVVGSCQNCTEVGCEGAACSTAGACASGLVCVGGQCTAACTLYPNSAECQSGGASLAVALTLPQSASLNDVAVAGEQVSVGAGARVIAQFTRRPANLAATGPGGIQIGVGAVVGGIWSSGPVALESSSWVASFVETSAAYTAAATAVQEGALIQDSDQLTAKLKAIRVTWPQASSGSVTVGNGETMVKMPGRYGDVHVHSGAVLHLSSGIYYLESLRVDSGGHLALANASGALRIFVKKQISFGGLLTSTSDLANVLFTAVGTEPLTIQAPIRATIWAPNAVLSLATSVGELRGSFFGKSVYIAPGTIVSHEPYRALQCTGDECGDPFAASCELNGELIRTYHLPSSRKYTDGGFGPVLRSEHILENTQEWVCFMSRLGGGSSGQHGPHARVSMEKDWWIGEVFSDNQTAVATCMHRSCFENNAIHNSGEYEASANAEEDFWGFCEDEAMDDEPAGGFDEATFLSGVAATSSYGGGERVWIEQSSAATSASRLKARDMVCPSVAVTGQARSFRAGPPGQAALFYGPNSTRAPFEEAGQFEILATTGETDQREMWLAPVSEAACYLSLFSGKFAGGGEFGRLSIERNEAEGEDYWKLYAQHLSGGAGEGIQARASCYSRDQGHCATFEEGSKPAECEPLRAQRFEWLQGQSKRAMGSAADRACFLTSVAGHFAGGGEQIHASVVHGSWELTGKSLQDGVRGRAQCVATPSMSDEQHWNRFQARVDLGPAEGQACFLTRVTGLLGGGGEQVRTFVEDGRWFLGGESQQEGVGASARCIPVENYDAPVDWEQGQDAVPLTADVPDPRKVCFLTRVRGRFKGGGESVGIDIVEGPSGALLQQLGGASQQVAVSGTAVCATLLADPAVGSAETPPAVARNCSLTETWPEYESGDAHDAGEERICFVSRFHGACENCIDDKYARVGRKTCRMRSCFAGSTIDDIVAEYPTIITFGDSDTSCDGLPMAVQLPGDSVGHVSGFWHSGSNAERILIEQATDPRKSTLAQINSCTGNLQVNVRALKLGASGQLMKFIGPNDAIGNLEDVGDFSAQATIGTASVAMSPVETSTCVIAGIGGKFNGGGEAVEIEREIVAGVERWVLKARALSGGGVQGTARCFPNQQNP